MVDEKGFAECAGCGIIFRPGKDVLKQLRYTLRTGKNYKLYHDKKCFESSALKIGLARKLLNLPPGFLNEDGFATCFECGTLFQPAASTLNKVRAGKRAHLFHNRECFLKYSDKAKRIKPL
jgi:uncharacterized protein (DUF2461 family)